MASFPLSQEDVLLVSLSANALLLLQAFVGRLLQLLHFALRGRSRLLALAAEVNRTRPGLVGRILYEQLSLWMFLTLVTVCLRTTDLSTYPFRRHELDLSRHPLLHIVLSLSAARSLLCAARLVLGKEITVTEDHAKFRVAVGQTNNVLADVFLTSADAASKLVCLSFRQNIFLSLVVSFCELSTGTLELYRISTLFAHSVSKSRTRGTAAMLNFVVFASSAVVLPAVFLILALLEETPTVMDTIPLVFFFVMGAVRLVFHAVWLYQSAIFVLRPPALPAPPPSIRTPGPSLHILTNDIHLDDSCSPGNGSSMKDPLVLSAIDPLPLRSYDNRNISYVRSNGGGISERINILNRKDTSKNTLLYKPSKQSPNVEGNLGVFNEKTTTTVEKSSDGFNQSDSVWLNDQP